eukprot:scaffold669_cov379-Prasinococcus_capsulatus_cf.AAC.7
MKELSYRFSILYQPSRANESSAVCQSAGEGHFRSPSPQRRSVPAAESSIVAAVSASGSALSAGAASR